MIMNMKIVADSSANLLNMDAITYASVPLKLVTDTREYVDDEHLDAAQMMADLAVYKGRSGSSCPSVGDWLEAFGDAQYIFTLAITQNLSGSHNAALQAKEVYEEQHPDRRVCCLDTLTTGPELVLIAEKLRELAAQGLDFDQIQAQITTYMEKTHLAFMLSSVDNLAKNGRVSPLIAKAVGFLNIRIVGKASDSGTFQQMHKCRGEKKGLDALLGLMKDEGFSGGPVRIVHAFNEPAAQALKELVLAEFPDAQVTIGKTGGLCSFYAEQGGLLVGFEG